MVLGKSALLVLLLVSSVLAGCSSPPAEPAPEPEPPRQAIPADPQAGWLFGACEHFQFQILAPAAQLRPLLPERYTVLEVRPGLGNANILTTACQNATLDNGTLLRDIRHVALSIQIESAGTAVDLFLVEWLVSDPVLAQALSDKGFIVSSGDFTVEPGVLAPAGYQRTTVLGPATKASVEWHGTAWTTTQFSSVPVSWVQDQQGADVRAAITFPRAYLADGIQDQCAIFATDDVWKTALDPGVIQCRPYGIGGDIGFTFPTSLAASSN